MLNEESYNEFEQIFHGTYCNLPFGSLSALTESITSQFCLLASFISYGFFNFHRLKGVIFPWFSLSSLFLSTTIASKRVRHEIHRWISRCKKLVNTLGELCNAPPLQAANACKNRIPFLIFRRISATQIGSSAAACIQVWRKQEWKKWVMPDWWACWRAACASCFASNAYFIRSSMEISQLELLPLE